MPTDEQQLPLHPTSPVVKKMPVAICLVTLLALLATPVLGVIYNITVPDRLWAGQAFTATLQESESPVTYNEFGVASLLHTS